MFDKGNEGIPHSHVVSICFLDEANRGLGVNSVV